MRRLAGMLAVLGIALIPALASPAAGPPSVTIHAQFLEAERATHYTVIVTNEPLGEVPVVFWKLTIMQIDSNGKVDPTCTRTGDGDLATEFIWYHADTDGCHHEWQGEHGHQGRISVNVQFKDWGCNATYDGSTGVPPEGPTMPCEARTPSTSTLDPCDEARARLAQIEIEIASAETLLKEINDRYYRAYISQTYAEYGYYTQKSISEKSPETTKAWVDWYVAYNKVQRIVRWYSETQARIRILKREEAKVKAALAACTGKSKRLAALGPGARCSSALLTAARARGRAAGYADVARRFDGAVFVAGAAKLRVAAGEMRKAAAHVTAQRSRLLADARRADQAAAQLAKDAADVAAMKKQEAAAARTARLAQSALAKCHSGG